MPNCCERASPPRLRQSALVDAYAGQISELIARNSTTESQANLLTSELQHLRRQMTEFERVAAMQQSILWRVTAPLRAVRSLVRGAKAAARRYVAGGVRAVYGGLPLSIEARLKIKSTIFRTAPVLFRHTTTYRAWEAHRRTQLRLDAEPPRRVSVETASLVGAPTVSLQPFDSENSCVPLADAACTNPRIKAVAFYLPQFHPIPENDQWWGKGFTEWTNVMRGRPQFDGHYQPHLPGELGFYDLRLVEVQQRQIELARLYGLHGFCYHHYWFGGRRLLRRPLDQILAHSKLRPPVLSVLGERELDPAMGRSR